MSTFNCPHCGATLKVIPLAGTGGGWERGQTFAMGGAPPPGAEYSREVPAADLSGVEAGVKTPLFQALLTGAAVGAVTVIITIWKDLAWPTPIIAAVIAAALAWWLLLLQSRQLLSSRETVTADPGTGDPAFSVEITLPPTEGKKMLFVNFPGCRPEHLRRFAQAAVEGKPTSEGARLSRAKFNAIRAECLRRGLVRWFDPEYHTLGLRTTSMGKAAFQKLLDGVLD